MKKNIALITQPTALYIFCKKNLVYCLILELKVYKFYVGVSQRSCSSWRPLSSTSPPLSHPWGLLSRCWLHIPLQNQVLFFVTGDLCQQSTFLSPFIWWLMTFFMFTYMSPSGVWSRSRRVAQRSTSWRSWWWGSIVLLTMLTMLWKLWKFWQNWQCWKFWQSLQCWQRWQC